MKFVALLTGDGEGCDYAIDCNKKFEVFEARGVPEALKRCEEMWKDHGGSEGDPRVEEIELYVVSEEVPVPVRQWNERGAEELEREDAERELGEAERRVKDLRAKLGK